MFNTIPKVLKSKYKTNSSNSFIVLKNHIVSIIQDKNNYEILGEFIFYWNPYPHVEINTTLNFTPNLKPGECIIQNAEDLYPGKIISLNFDEGVSDIVIKINDNFIFGEKINVNFIIFHIPNFIDYDGYAIREKSSISHGRLIFSDNKYRVIIDKLFNFDKVMKSFYYNSGSAITHNAMICKLDDSCLTFNEAIEKLDELNRFFSFLRGHKISAVLPIGFEIINKFPFSILFKKPFSTVKVLFSSKSISKLRNIKNWKYLFAKAKIRWEIWDYNDKAEHFKGVLSWFRYNLTEEIEELYSKYIQIMKNSDWKNCFIIISDLYFQSNQKNGDIITLISINQVVFEHISWIKYVEIDRTDTPAQNNNKNAEAKLRDIINWLNISPSIPSNFTNLSSIALTNSWTDGVQSLIRIRNKFIHPKSGDFKSSFDENVKLEAWTLGIYYIELILLRIIDFKGNYYNRIEKKVEKVPWA